MDEFEKCCEQLRHYLDGEQVRSIQEAYQLAKTAHAEQRRYTGEEYISHPVAVATILAEMHMDPATITAALLHDVIEDTYIEKKDIETQFGKEVADLVDGVTKLTQIQFENRAEAQAENFRKMIMAMSKDIRVILIKLADRLHNMRSIHSLPRPKRRRIAKETLEIFAPIANRLGMHTLRVECEDLGFSALYPLRYRVLKEAVAKAHGNRREIMELIDSEIRGQLKKSSIHARSLIGREKHVYSIYKKMHDKHLTFTEVMDVYGFRIIVDKMDTCYRVLGVLHNLYKPIAQRFKDYVAIPKANGYQSLHTTLFGPYGVPIEVQIRTEEMHKMAEFGISAHWRYKTERIRSNDAQQRAQEWLKGILEMHRSAKNSLEFIEHVKTDLFPDEVYVFTPKGTILELPAGATPVDFAYTIHSDIGNTCIAAKLDKRLAPLSTPLTNGQQVEIITAPGARPNPAWLNFVVTGKARSNIKHFLKKQKKEELIILGKQLLEKALIPFGLHLDAVLDDEWMYLLNLSKLDSITHLFEEIGLGNRLAFLSAKQLARLKQIQEVTGSETHRPQPLFIKGSEGILITYAACCRPIPGDPIGGYIESGHGLMVHSESCPALAHYHRYPEKYLALQWEESVKGDFSIDLHVDITNHRGSLANLMLALSELESNIENIHTEKMDHQCFSINLTITVHDRVHLARILRKLRHKKNVIRIFRNKPKPIKSSTTR